MSFSRTTPSGRRITATARAREEPDMKRLVALVLHLAEQLHEEEHHNGGAGGSSAAAEGHDDDTLTPSTSRG
ncbi:hypothetical protein [Psychromicrobium xiongbiense]|uniref:hypothetical protein n=1 Tax=Psychromicrobium xiongbiense TaxID=3051184 RepID=UPI002553FFB4|nr:hypothetical protein [Psychromicrobium sp. YIM S02556]